MEKAKKYKMQYSPLILSLIVVLNLITLAGIVLNAIRIKDYNELTTSNKVLLILILLLSAFLLVVSVFLLLRRYYRIKDGQIILNVSIFSFKTNLSDVLSITYFKKTEKLCVREKDGKYFLVLISAKDFNEFASETVKGNSEIVYSPYEEE